MDWDGLIKRNVAELHKAIVDNTPSAAEAILVAVIMLVQVMSELVEPLERIASAAEALERR